MRSATNRVYYLACLTFRQPCVDRRSSIPAPNKQKRKMNTVVLSQGHWELNGKVDIPTKVFKSRVHCFLHYLSPWSWHGQWLFILLMLTIIFSDAWTQLRFVFSQWWMCSQHSEKPYYASHYAKTLCNSTHENPSHTSMRSWGSIPEQSVLEPRS